MSIKLALAMAVGLLLCSLATLEFPELVTLSDNTSNDFSLQVLGGGRAIAVQKNQTPRPERSAIPEVARLLHSATPRVFDFSLSLQSTNDLLRLLCIQRT